MEQVVAANNDFAMDLYAKIRNDPGQANKNIFFSPFSVSTALALIYAGARGNTKSQMGNVLNLDSIDNVDDGFRELLETFNDTATEYTLNVVNALFRRKKHPFLQTYLDLASQSYHSLLRSMDFVKTSELSRIRINRWVANRTNKKILNLLGPGSIDASTVLVVVNAIYFNGFWKNPFDAHDTYPDPFNLSASNSVILQLPYVGDQLAMHILLPNKVDGLASLESKLTIAGLNDAIASMYETDLDVSIPKFKLTQTLGLSDILKSMGMVDVFDDTLADLSGIDNSGDLSVSGVIHKAYVDINEEGTEAAGATGMILGSTGFAEPVSFKANHPFLFFIKDNATGSILFSGRFVAPSG
ncbi:Serpin B3, partial [Lamellibrachia satsuma]